LAPAEGNKFCPQRGQLTIERVDHPQRYRCRLPSRRAERIQPRQTLWVRAEQGRLCGRAQMEQGRMDALLPAGPFLEQIIVQPHLGADLQHVARRDPTLRELLRLQQLAQVLGVEAVGLGVLSPALQAGDVSGLSKMRPHTRRLAFLNHETPTRAALHRQIDRLSVDGG
jgi:hypothetical protein